MISPKNKLRLCLISVVLLAVFAGGIYYLWGEEEIEEWGQGTLITIMSME